MGALDGKDDVRKQPEPGRGANLSSKARHDDPSIGRGLVFASSERSSTPHIEPAVFQGGDGARVWKVQDQASPTDSRAVAEIRDGRFGPELRQRFANAFQSAATDANATDVSLKSAINNTGAHLNDLNGKPAVGYGRQLDSKGNFVYYAFVANTPEQQRQVLEGIRGDMQKEASGVSTSDRDKALPANVIRLGEKPVPASFVADGQKGEGWSKASVEMFQRIADQARAAGYTAGQAQEMFHTYGVAANTAIEKKNPAITDSRIGLGGGIQDNGGRFIMVIGKDSGDIMAKQITGMMNASELTPEKGFMDLGEFTGRRARPAEPGRKI